VALSLYSHGDFGDFLAEGHSNVKVPFTQQMCMLHAVQAVSQQLDDQLL